MNDPDSNGADTLRALPLQILFCLLLVGVIVAVTWKRAELPPPASHPVIAEHLP